MVAGRKKGQVVKQRGSFKAVMSRHECSADAVKDGAALSVMLHAVQANVDN